MSSRWARASFAAAYLAVMTWIVYVYVDDYAQDARIALVGGLVLSLAVGFLVPRSWVLLPLALVALSIPAGNPTEDPEVWSEPTYRTWVAVGLLWPVVAIVIGTGRLGRWAVEKLRARSS